MKKRPRLILTSLAFFAIAPSLRAEFLVLKIRENTAEQIWIWIAALTALLIVFTMRNSRSKGGQGR